MTHFLQLIDVKAGGLRLKKGQGILHLIFPKKQGALHPRKKKKNKETKIRVKPLQGATGPSSQPDLPLQLGLDPIWPKEA